MLRVLGIDAPSSVAPRLPARVALVKWAACVAVLSLLGAAQASEAASWGAAVEGPRPAGVATSWRPLPVTVTCVSPGNCVAVARYAASGDITASKVVTFTQRSGTWGKAALVRGTDPSLRTFVVSCWSPGNCEGVASPGSGPASFFSQKNGVWSRKSVDAQLPANADSGKNALGLSCRSSASCVAFGTYHRRGGGVESFRQVVLTKAKGVWGPGQPLKGANVTDAIPDELDCNRAHDYCAVLPASGTLLAAKAGRWQKPVKIPAGIGSISCSSAGNCGALAGNVVYTQIRGKWSDPAPVQLPEDAAPFGGSQLGGESGDFACSSPGNCIAAGYYHSNDDGFNNTSPMVVAQVDGKLQRAIQARLPDEAYRAPDGSTVLPRAWGFARASCGSDGNCSVTGVYRDGEPTSSPPPTSQPTPTSYPGGDHGLLIDLVNGQWQQGIGETLPAGAANPTARLFGINCAGSGQCSAAGTYRDADGELKVMLVSRR